MKLVSTAGGLPQGRLYQLSAYMLTIMLFALTVAVLRIWRNDRAGHLFKFWLSPAGRSASGRCWSSSQAIRRPSRDSCHVDEHRATNGNTNLPN